MSIEKFTCFGYKRVDGNQYMIYVYYMISFKDYLKLHIKRQGITWRHASIKLGVPYSTLRQWKGGDTNPPVYVRELIKKEINSWSIPTETEN